MANNFTGRQLIIDTAPVTIPLANFKVEDAIWTNMLASATLTIVDGAGRTYTFTAYQANYPYTLFKFGWISAPATVTVLSSGILYIALGTK
jgi:hypothetical protein